MRIWTLLLVITVFAAGCSRQPVEVETTDGSENLATSTLATSEPDEVTPVTQAPAVEPEVPPTAPPVLAIAEGMEVDLASALLQDTAWSATPIDRSFDSGLYEHHGRNPSADCAGLLRGQIHEKTREATARFRWIDPTFAVYQTVSAFGQVSTAILHMDQLEQLGVECSTAEIRCDSCPFDSQQGHDRDFTITPLDTGVRNVLAYQLTAGDEGVTEWRARYRRGDVVSSIRMIRDVSDAWPTREQDVEAFAQTVRSMADALDNADVRPIAGVWPDAFVVNEFTIELHDVKIDHDYGTPWVDYRGSGSVAHVYASEDADGNLIDSVGIFLIDDPHDPEDVDYTLGDYSYFDDETTVAGRQAIWMPWYDEDMENSMGNLLVWDASPEAYGWMQSRTFTLNQMRAIAAQLTIEGTDFRWDQPTDGLEVVAEDVIGIDAEDHLDRGGLFASYDISWENEDSDYGEIVLAFFPLIEGEIEALRSLAFAEQAVEVRGTTGYQLLIEPVSEHEDGESYLVWQEDSVTLAIATADHAHAAQMLVTVADSFDRDRPYD